METYELSTDVLGRWTIGRSAKDLVHLNTGMPVGGKGPRRYLLGPAVCFSLSLSLGPPDLKHCWATLVVTVEASGVSIGL